MKKTRYMIYRNPGIQINVGAEEENFKKRRSQIYKKPDLRSLLEEDNESRTQKCYSATRAQADLW